MKNHQNEVIVLRKGKDDDGVAKTGGAWKLAYADFVTAMMAFFLLMWLLSSPKPSDLAGLADYFTLTQPVAEKLKGQSSSQSESTTSNQGGKAREQATESQPIKATSMLELAQQEMAALQEVVDQQKLEDVRKQIEKMIQNDPEAKQLKEQIRLENSVEGLLIQLIDGGRRPMFDSGSSNLKPYAAEVMSRLTRILSQVPNKVAITGHTDATPFSSRGGAYGNWELSSDRANSTRRQMVTSGLSEPQVIRVVGMASASPLSVEVTDPVNRRIEILVLTRKSEIEVLQRSIIEGLQAQKNLQPAPVQQ